MESCFKVRDMRGRITNSLLVVRSLLQFGRFLLVDRNNQKTVSSKTGNITRKEAWPGLARYFNFPSLTLSLSLSLSDCNAQL